VVLSSNLLARIAVRIDDIFSGHPTLELFAIMICCPLAMNAAQLVFQDVVLKHRPMAASTIAIEVDGISSSRLMLTPTHQSEHTALLEEE